MLVSGSVFQRNFGENKNADSQTLAIQSYPLMIGVSNHLLSIVFRFHYHSQKVIGSLQKGKAKSFRGG